GAGDTRAGVDAIGGAVDASPRAGACARPCDATPRAAGAVVFAPDAVVVAAGAGGACSGVSLPLRHAQPTMTTAAPMTAAAPATPTNDHRDFPAGWGPCTVKTSGTCPGGRFCSDFFSASRM
ncbi:MAG TPA: hypothetical protein VI078_09795, partial [bacterium]